MIFPPASESLAENVKLGLLTVDEDGTIHAVPRLGPRQMWGEIELRRLVEAVWPDIPKSGVHFDRVIEKAIAGRLALSEANTNL